MSAESEGGSDRIETLEQRVAELESALEERGSSSTRRRVLGGLAGAGILGMGSASASAQPNAGSARSNGGVSSAEDLDGSTAALGVEDDPRGVSLVGSGNPSSPAGGLASAIERALSNGARNIDVRGAWRMGDSLRISSGKYAPHPINLNCEGAFILYGGSGWCITNDNSNHHRGQTQGGVLQLYGGIWRGRGSPRGWFRGIDVCANRIYPTMVRDFKGASYRIVRPQPNKKNGFGSGFSPTRKVGSAAIQLEEGGMDVKNGRWTGGKWSEANMIGGGFHANDTGIRGVASRGDSFQGNYIDRVQFSAHFDYGFDLSGNWLECKFDKPEMTTSSNGAALFRHNGNMAGSVITAPECEDTSKSRNYSYFEIGPFATKGPQTIGGLWTSPSNQKFIRDPLAGSDRQPPWTHYANRMVDRDYYIERYSRGTSQRFGLTSNGFEFSTSNNARNWNTQFRIGNSGNTQR